MKIALFGGTGHIGSLVLQQALAQGHKVTALVRSRAKIDAHTATTAHIVVGSIENQTAVRYALAPQGTELPKPPLPEGLVNDIAASFQAAVVESLVEKTIVALAQTKLSRLCVGGGVAANRLLRSRLLEEMTQRSVELHIAPPALCTDNAVMGAIAWEMFAAGQLADLELDVLPGLLREHGTLHTQSRSSRGAR